MGCVKVTVCRRLRVDQQHLYTYIIRALFIYHYAEPVKENELINSWCPMHMVYGSIAVMSITNGSTMLL